MEKCIYRNDGEILFLELLERLEIGPYSSSSSSSSSSSLDERYDTLTTLP